MAMRILLADDSLFWRENLRMILEEKSEWTVYQATNSAEALQKSSWVQPNAIILDASMPVLDGLSAARELKRLSPQVPLLIVTVDKTTFLEVKSTKQVFSQYPPRWTS